jgi:hypothetical protein
MTFFLQWQYENALHLGSNMEKLNTEYLLTNILNIQLVVRLAQSVSDWLRAGRSGDRIPVGVRFSAPVQTGPGAHPASCKMGTGSFPRVESGRGVTLTPHPFLVPSSKHRVELYIYSPFVACKKSETYLLSAMLFRGRVFLALCFRVSCQSSSFCATLEFQHCAPSSVLTCNPSRVTDLGVPYDLEYV